MATFTEELKLLITATSKGAVSELNKTATATEQLTTKQKAMSLASGGAHAAMSQLGISSEAAGAGLQVAAVAAGAAVAVKVGKWAKDAADEASGLAKEIRNFQRVTGAGAEDASRWVATFDDLEVSSSKGATAFFKLGRALADGQNPLEQYGVAVVHAKDGTVDMTATMLNIADAYAKTTDPAERAALATAAFGKAGKDLAPVLEQGSKGLKEFFAGAESGHQVMTQDQVDMFRQYDLALNNLGDTLRGFKLQVGAAVAPVITQVASTLTNTLDAVDNATEHFGGLQKVIKTGWELTPLADGLHLISSASELAQGHFAAAGEEFAKSIPVVGDIVSLFDDGADSVTTFASSQEQLKTSQQKVLDLTLQHKQGTKEYADAVRDANAAQKEIEGSLQKSTKALQDHSLAQQQDMMQTLSAGVAGVNYSNALLAVNDAQDKYNALLAAGAQPGQTAEQYNNDLAQAANVVTLSYAGAIKAAGDKALADSAGKTPAQQAAAATDAQNAAILALASSSPQAVTELQKLGYQVMIMPDGKAILFPTDAPMTKEQIAELQRQLESFVAYANANGYTGGLARTDPTARGRSVAPAALTAGPMSAMVAPMALGAAAPGARATPLAAAPIPVSAGPTFVVNVVTRGLGSDAPEIQRAVVDAIRGYVQRNGRLEEIVR